MLRNSMKKIYIIIMQTSLEDKRCPEKRSHTGTGRFKKSFLHNIVFIKKEAGPARSTLRIQDSTSDKCLDILICILELPR